MWSSREDESRDLPIVSQLMNESGHAQLVLVFDKGGISGGESLFLLNVITRAFAYPSQLSNNSSKPIWQKSGPGSIVDLSAFCVCHPDPLFSPEALIPPAAGIVGTHNPAESLSETCLIPREILYPPSRSLPVGVLNLMTG